MIKLLLTVILSLTLYISAFGQQVFYEQDESNLFHFYYDESYYLVDKACQYLQIERVAGFNVTTQKLDGEFGDYDINNGALLLSGNFENGMKNGLFTAYYRDSTIKWQVNFTNDQPIGSWKFFYPDGKPLMEIEYSTTHPFLIKNYWNVSGQKEITDGNGRYDFSVKSVGYNESGYAYTRYSGPVKNGFPNGNWTINYIYPNNEQETVGYEKFADSLFVGGVDSQRDRNIRYSDYSRVIIGPLLEFIRGETMIHKACTVDEHEGFTTFLTEKLEQLLLNSLQKSSFTGVEEFEVTADITKNGEYKKIEVRKGFEESDQKNKQRLRSALERGLAGIPYWLPSYKDGAYVDDELTIRFSLSLDSDEKVLRVSNLSITRANGY